MPILCPMCVNLGNLSGWLDYDRPHLPALDLHTRIDYFEKRVTLVLVNPLKRILDNEILLPNSSALLIFGVSLTCAIEAIGKFLTGGQGGNGARFRRFVEDYMDAAFYTMDLNGDSYGYILWTYFRNSLAHGFSVCHGGFDANNGAYFAIKADPGYDCLMINPTLLYADFVQGLNQYLADLRAAPAGSQLLTDFDSVFQSVFILGQ